MHRGEKISSPSPSPRQRLLNKYENGRHALNAIPDQSGLATNRGQEERQRSIPSQANRNCGPATGRNFFSPGRSIVIARKARVIGSDAGGIDANGAAGGNRALPFRIIRSLYPLDRILDVLCSDADRAHAASAN